MAKKTPKGAIKIDLGLNKTSGGIAASKVRKDAKPKTGISGDSLMGVLSKPIKRKSR